MRRNSISIISLEIYHGPTPSLPAVRCVLGVRNYKVQEDQTDSDQSSTDPVDSSIDGLDAVTGDEEKGGDGYCKRESCENPQTCLPCVSVVSAGPRI
jgi:hypothetical protein